MSLANKYRPSSFDDVVGQTNIMGILKSMCNMDRLSNRNFLFTGPAGTGKTTTARIIAKTLNGNLDNIIEIDAASHNGVDDVREIIQQASTYPIGTKYKIFIIDEVHSLSSNSWQALLKTLEEQPAATIFIMATTNPEKIPDTILSRVQTFKLSKLSTEQIYNRLIDIINNENAISDCEITYESDAIRFLANYANGGMRDAITSLDKTLAFSKHITSELLVTSLDLPNYDDYFGLLNAIAKKDNSEITLIINNVYNSGTNFIKWFEGFHSFICNILKFIFTRDITLTMIPMHYHNKLSGYKELHATICMRLSNVLLAMIKDMKLSQYQQEIALTYLLTTKPNKENKQ